MKTLDLFYDEILVPIGERIAEISEVFLELLIVVVLFITVPLWIVPYKIIKHRENKKGETDES